MSLVCLENCSYKKSVLLFFVNWRYSIFLNRLIQQMVLNAICYLLCSLIANMATILINFQQKFALVRGFQHFTIKLLCQKRFLARLKSASKSSVSWREKCDIFLLELYLAIDPSNLASENDVTQLVEFQMPMQK